MRLLLTLLALSVAAAVALWAPRRAAREVVAVLPDAHGLRAGDPVFFRGLAVGDVRTVEPAAGGVRVRLALRRADVPLRRTDLVRVRAEGVFGAVAAEVVPTGTTGPLAPARRRVPDTLAAGPYLPPDPALVRLAEEARDSLRGGRRGGPR